MQCKMNGGRRAAGGTGNHRSSPTFVHHPDRVQSSTKVCDQKAQSNAASVIHRPYLHTFLACFRRSIILICIRNCLPLRGWADPVLSMSCASLLSAQKFPRCDIPRSLLATTYLAHVYQRPVIRPRPSNRSPIT